MPDPVAQQVGYLAVMTENSDGEQRPIQVGLRLRIEGGEISEAEHLIVRNLSANAQANLESPRPPHVSPVEEPYRDSRSRLLHR